MPDEVDKASFIGIDLPAFFRDDKTLLLEPFDGDGRKAAFRQDAVAGQNGQRNALLNDIPDAGKIGRIVQHLWLELLFGKLSQDLTRQNEITAQQYQRIVSGLCQGDAFLTGQRMLTGNAETDGPGG